MAGKTRYQLELEIDFYVCLHRRHVTLFRRFRQLVTFVSLIGGGAAFAALSDELHVSKTAAMAASATVFCFSLIDLIFDFSGRCAHHERLRHRYAMLRKDCAKLKVGAIETEFQAIYADDNGCIRSLRYPSRNEVLTGKGHVVTRKNSMWEGVLDAIS